jgi:hypothetical protein
MTTILSLWTSAPRESFLLFLEELVWNKVEMNLAKVTLAQYFSNVRSGSLLSQKGNQ